MGDLSKEMRYLLGILELLPNISSGRGSSHQKINIEEKTGDVAGIICLKGSPEPARLRRHILVTPQVVYVTRISLNLNDKRDRRREYGKHYG